MTLPPVGQGQRRDSLLAPRQFVTMTLSPVGQGDRRDSFPAKAPAPSTRGPGACVLTLRSGQVGYHNLPESWLLAIPIRSNRDRDLTLDPR
jgi:hypothetical protein